MHSNHIRAFSTEVRILLIALVGFAAFAYAPASYASAFSEACTDVNTLVDQVVTFLGAISVAVVTIAIIFAGYQVAFAHKRMTDVAPILIGGLLIGGAAQIATWLMDSAEKTCT